MSLINSSLSIIVVAYDEKTESVAEMRVDCWTPYRTCRFSQLFDLESRAHTRPSSPFTLRLADVLEPRYFLGLLREDEKVREKRENYLMN